MVLISEIISMVHSLTVNWSMSCPNSIFTVGDYEKEISTVAKKTKQIKEDIVDFSNDSLLWEMRDPHDLCHRATFLTRLLYDLSLRNLCSSNLLLVFNVQHILWIINILSLLKHLIPIRIYKHQYWVSAVNTTAKDRPLTVTCKIVLAMIYQNCKYCIMCELSIGRSVSPGLILVWLGAGLDLFTLLKFQKYSSLLITMSEAITKPVNQKQ